MKNLIVMLSLMNAMFMIMHEFDAFFLGEWRMFKFLRRYQENAQYMIFLYAHIPFILIYFYYLFTVISFSSFYLWVTVNLVSILHLVIHLIAKKWSSNVFKSANSFVFILGAAVTGCLNLLLLPNYIK